MARIPYLEVDDMPEPVRSHFKTLPPMNLFRLLLHSPANAVEFTRLGVSTLLEQELPDRLRELAILRLSYLLDCQTQWLQHANIAQAHGLTKEQLDAIRHWPDVETFDDLDESVLRFTDELTQQGKALDDACRALHEYLADRQMVELAIAVCFNGMIARITETFQIEPESTAGSYTLEQLREDQES